jgi:hypothetical protein
VNLKGVRRKRDIRVEMVLPIRVHVRGVAFVDEATRAIARRALGVSGEVHDICALDSRLIVGRSVSWGPESLRHRQPGGQLYRDDSV